MVRAEIIKINGLYIEYKTFDGKIGIDDSTFDEINNYKIGDIIKLTKNRIETIAERQKGGE